MTKAASHKGFTQSSLVFGAGSMGWLMRYAGGGGRFLSKAQPCPVCSWSCEDWLSVPGRPTSLHPEVPGACLDESLAMPVPTSVCGMCIVYTFMAQHVHVYTVCVCTIEPVYAGTCVCTYTWVCQAVCGT